MPDIRLKVGIELDLVYCWVSLGDLDAAKSQARAAVEDAEAAGEGGMLGDALAVLTMAEFLSGLGVDRERLARALTLEDPAMPRSWHMRPAVIRGMIQLWTGELADALETLGAVHAESIERGLESFTPMLVLYRVWAAVWHGDLPRAARWSDEGRAAASLVGDPNAIGIALSASALVHAHDGRTDLARLEADEALKMFERLQWRSGMIWPLWALGLAAMSDGSPAATDAVLRPLAEQVTAMGAGDPVLTMFLPDELEALIALGELDLARALPGDVRGAGALARPRLGACGGRPMPRRLGGRKWRTLARVRGLRSGAGGARAHADAVRASSDVVARRSGVSSLQATRESPPGAHRGGGPVRGRGGASMERSCAG